MTDIVQLSELIHQAVPKIDPLTPMWRATLRAFYGLPLELEDEDHIMEATGRAASTFEPGRAFRELWCCNGRRARKSSTAALATVYEAVFGGHEQYLMPGERGTVALVSKDIAATHNVAAFQRTFLQALSIPFRETSEGSVRVIRLEGVPADIKLMASTTDAGRSDAIFSVICDEIAHWPSSDRYRHPDTEVLASLTPAMAQFPNAKTFAISTPFARAGMHFDTIDAAWGNLDEREVLATKGPTWRWNPSITEARTRQMQRDPMRWAREYGAEPMSNASAAFFDLDSLEAARNLPSIDARGGAVRMYAGGDLGFVRDSSALCIVGEQDGHVELLRWLELRPEPGQPLVPSAVCKAFAGEMRRAGMLEAGWAHVMMDAHYEHSAREHLREYGVAVQAAPGGATGKEDVHTEVRDLIREGRVRIPPGAKKIITQLNEIVARPTTGGRLAITAPRSSRGGHGDLASAFVLAVYQATKAKPRSFSAYLGRDDDAPTYQPRRQRSTSGAADFLKRGRGL